MENILQELINKSEKFLNTTSQWNADELKKTLNQAKQQVNLFAIPDVSKRNEQLINYCNCPQPTPHNWDYDLKQWKCEKCKKVI